MGDIDLSALSVHMGLGTGLSFADHQFNQQCPATTVSQGVASLLLLFYLKRSDGPIVHNC